MLFWNLCFLLLWILYFAFGAHVECQATLEEKKMARNDERSPSRSRSSSRGSRNGAVEDTGNRSRSPSRERRRKRSRSRSKSRSTYSRSGSPTDCKRLHIANLDDSVRRRDIEDAFGKFGKLSDCWIASYPPYYAFVVFERNSDATEALKEMRSGYIRNCHIRTTVALPRQFRRGPPPRRFGGGGGDRYGDRDRYRGRRSPRRRSHSRSRSPRKTRRNRSYSRSVSR